MIDLDMRRELVLQRRASVVMMFLYGAILALHVAGIAVVAEIAIAFIVVLHFVQWSAVERKLEDLTIKPPD